MSKRENKNTGKERPATTRTMDNAETWELSTAITERDILGALLFEVGASDTSSLFSPEELPRLKALSELADRRQENLLRLKKLSEPALMLLKYARYYDCPSFHQALKDLAALGLAGCDSNTVHGARTKLTLSHDDYMRVDQVFAAMCELRANGELGAGLLEKAFEHVAARSGLPSKTFDAAIQKLKDSWYHWADICRDMGEQDIAANFPKLDVTLIRELSLLHFEWLPEEPEDWETYELPKRPKHIGDGGFDTKLTRLPPSSPLRRTCQ